MNLDFDQKEATILKRILAHYLSDLRMEVSGTESYDMRKSLKEDEEFIKKIIAKLEQIAE